MMVKRTSDDKEGFPDASGTKRVLSQEDTPGGLWKNIPRKRGQTDVLMHLNITRGEEI